MLQDFDDTNDEVEEILELIYNLLKDFPAGVTSQFLEEQYNKRYVDTGVARPLPKDWVRHTKHADEFEVKQLGIFTMLYLVNVECLHSLNSRIYATSLKTVDERQTVSETPKSTINLLSTDMTNPVAALDSTTETRVVESPVEHNDKMLYDLEPMTLLSMPVGTSVQVHVVLASDPDNIFIRLCSWDPVPDYLYSALLRIPDTKHDPPLQISVDQILAAPINNVWERVRVERKSNKFPGYWIVFVIDIGLYHILHETQMRHLSDAVVAFKKIFLARIKLTGITPLNDIIESPAVNSSKKNNSTYWSREVQKFVTDYLKNANNNNEGGAVNRNIELISVGDWSYDEKLKLPFANARLIINGKDFNETLINAKLVK